MTLNMHPPAVAEASFEPDRQVLRTSPAPIVFVLPDLGAGGAQRVMLLLAAHLDQARFAPRLLVVGGAQTLAVPDGLAVERGGASRLVGGLPWLLRRLRALHPAAVVSTLGYTNFALLGLAPLLPRNIRLVVREANVPATTLSELPGWLRKAAPYRRLYPRATRVLAQTGAIAQALAEAAPRARAAIRILPNPVDVARLRDAAGAPRRAAGPGLRLVAAGRLTRQKGFDQLIEAIPQLPPDSCLTIFGEGPDRAMLAARIAALGLNERVTLAGYSAALPSHLAGADALVMASRWEGLPNVALEALALGTPVVATPESALAEVAAQMPTGVKILDFGQDFVDHLIGLAPKPDPAGKLRPSLLPDEYAIASVVDRFERILEEALA